MSGTSPGRSDAKALVPKRPPGRSSRKARGFALQIRELQARGYTLDAIREALGVNEIYARIRHSGLDLKEIARDNTDFKSLIAQARDTAEKLALAQKLATRRLASGVVPELDACFAALELTPRST